MSECKLCLNNKKLCKSHIYPEYMYKHCYDENHSFIEFNAKEYSYNKKRRKGIYEKLLCRDCEDIIKTYEDYAKSILYDKAKEYIKKHNNTFIVQEYDYVKFKLFVLSLIWRSSISSLESLEKASLGIYEEELRLALLNETSFPVNNYPCMIYQTHLEDKLSDGVFMEIFPTISKQDGKTIYQFIVDGLFFFVGIGVVSSKTFPDGSSVSPDNLRIGYDHLAKLTSFNDVFARLSKQGKFSAYND